MNIKKFDKYLIKFIDSMIYICCNFIAGKTYISWVTMRHVLKDRYLEHAESVVQPTQSKAIDWVLFFTKKFLFDNPFTTYFFSGHGIVLYYDEYNIGVRGR
jgi:hypothetical protein